VGRNNAEAESSSMVARQGPSPLLGPSVSIELARLHYRDVTPEDYDLLCLLDEDVPNRTLKTPVDFAASLPRLPARIAGVAKCHVCLEDLEPREQVMRLPCEHAGYHPDCVTRWLTLYSGACPLCAKAVQPPTIKDSSSKGEALKGQSSPDRLMLQRQELLRSEILEVVDDAAPRINRNSPPAAPRASGVPCVWSFICGQPMYIKAV